MPDVLVAQARHTRRRRAGVTAASAVAVLAALAGTAATMGMPTFPRGSGVEPGADSARFSVSINGAVAFADQTHGFATVSRCLLGPGDPGSPSDDPSAAPAPTGTATRGGSHGVTGGPTAPGPGPGSGSAGATADPSGQDQDDTDPTTECTNWLRFTEDGGRTWGTRALPVTIGSHRRHLGPTLRAFSARHLVLHSFTRPSWVSDDAGRTWNRTPGAPGRITVTPLPSLPENSVPVWTSNPRLGQRSMDTAIVVLLPDGTYGAVSGPSGLGIMDVSTVPARDGSLWLSCVDPDEDRACTAVTTDRGRTWQISWPDSPTTPATTVPAYPPPPSGDLIRILSAPTSKITALDSQRMCFVRSSLTQPLPGSRSAPEPSGSSPEYRSALFCTADGGRTWVKPSITSPARAVVLLGNGDALALSVNPEQVLLMAAGSTTFTPVEGAPTGVGYIWGSGPWVVASDLGEGRDDLVSLDGRAWKRVPLE